MTQNNNLSVLPFYASIEEQNHRRSYAYGDIYPLFTPAGHVPPFQLIVPYHATETVAHVAVFDAKGTVVTQDIISGMSGLQVLRYQSEGYNVIIYPDNGSVGALLDEGQYFLGLQTSLGTNYYSDMLTVVGQSGGYLKIEWYDLEDLVMDGCRIVYTMDHGTIFKNRLYLDTQVGKPDYTFEEQGETRDGLWFPEKMLSEKTYKFTFLASEYLCDVMRFIRMSDNVKITDNYGRVYQCDTFLMTPKWEAQGNLAAVEVEFQTNTVAKRIGRAFT